MTNRAGNIILMGMILGAIIGIVGGYYFGTFFLYISFLGTIFLNALKMIVVPLIYPIMKTFDVNFVWFGLLTVIAIEVGLITPPLGIAAYVVKSTLDDQKITLNDVFAGAFPFVLIMILVLALVTIFPQVSLVLVR